MKPVTKELKRLRYVGRRLLRTPPVPWAVRAACLGHDPELWMDDMKGPPGESTAAAKAICAACPVRAACLAHALSYDEPWGIWGGLTTRERVAHRRGLPVLSGVPDEHRPYMGARGPRRTKPSAARQAS